MDNSSDLDRNNIRKAALRIRKARGVIPSTHHASTLLREALECLAMVCDINKPVKKEITIKGGLLSPNEVYRDAAKMLKKEFKK